MARQTIRWNVTRCGRREGRGCYDWVTFSLHYRNSIHISPKSKNGKASSRSVLLSTTCATFVMRCAKAMSRLVAYPHSRNGGSMSCNFATAEIFLSAGHRTLRLLFHALPAPHQKSTRSPKTNPPLILPTLLLTTE